MRAPEKSIGNVGTYLSEPSGNRPRRLQPWRHGLGDFPHDHAARVIRWGEDGIGGICEPAPDMCFALALWNGRDPILKERLFGLTEIRQSWRM